MRKLYVGLTKHQQEYHARRNLWNQTYVSYLPKLYRHPSDPDFGKGGYGLRFPGYIFIACDCDLSEDGPIHNTRGMDSWGGSALLTTIIGHGKDAREVPWALPKGFIERLRFLEDEDMERALSRAKPEPRTDLRDGDSVVITDPDHKACGYSGIFSRNERGIAHVWIGRMCWEVQDIHLRIEKQARRAA